MWDLYLGIAIILLLMVMCFAVTLRLTRDLPKHWCDVLAILTVLAIGIYARWIWDDTVMGRLLPFSNLIIVSNWFPLATGILAALVWRRIEGGRQSRPRQIFATAILGISATYSLVRPLMGDVPVCGTSWEGDLCLQTSHATCSAAAGCTLLQYYDVFASEQEMATLCLTRESHAHDADDVRRNLLQQALQVRSGTTWKGLFRGLMLQATPIGYRVEVFDTNYDHLRETFQAPCILQCELRPTYDELMEKFEAQGWVPSQPHSLVLWNFNEDGTAIIADPFAGLEVWPRTQLETLWHGQTFRLVPQIDGNSIGR